MPRILVSDYSPLTYNKAVEMFRFCSLQKAKIWEGVILGMVCLVFGKKYKLYVDSGGVFEIFR